MSADTCSRCSKPAAAARAPTNFCPRCGRRLRPALAGQPADRAARPTSPALLALGAMCSLALAVAGVFLLVMTASGGGVWAMSAGLVTLSVGFAGVGSTAASALDTREPQPRAGPTSPPRRSS